MGKIVNKEELKKSIYAAIDAMADQVEVYVRDIEQHPELGFEEIRTAQKMEAFFRKLNLNPRTGLAVTGMEAVIDSGKQGPVIGFIGELDALICKQAPLADVQTGAAHQCGHHVQQGVLLAAASGFAGSGAMDSLCGKVKFIGAPAEELGQTETRDVLRAQGKLQYHSGKSELIRCGVFDDVDITMMMHCWSHFPGPLVVKGDKNLGFTGLNVRYIGKQAHAAAEPHEGINALSAAITGINAVHALRETFNEEDGVRVHFIITKGGEMANCIPDDVRLEVFVRANNIKAVEDNLEKVVRAFRCGAEALGARMEADIIPGMYPLRTVDSLFELYAANAREFVPQENFLHVKTMPASSDLGDVSQLMPVLYPMGGGIEGVGHGADFKMVNFQNAVIIPAKSLAATVVDLLYDEAREAKEVIAEYQPSMTRTEYLEKLDQYFSSKRQGNAIKGERCDN